MSNRFERASVGTMQRYVIEARRALDPPLVVPVRGERFPRERPTSDFESPAEAVENRIGGMATRISQKVTSPKLPASTIRTQ